MNGKINNFQQIASATRYQITSGKEAGLNVIDCNNGVIRFLLNESKGLDIMQLYHNGTNISFLSKNAFVDSTLPFLNRFEGGMLYTCGLDNIGEHEGYEMHGTYHLLKSSVTKVECDENGILVEAIIVDGALFGKNLVVKRKVTSAINSNTVRVEDTLMNKAYVPGEYCVLYHVNLGYPMLDEGAKIIADVKGFEPHTEWARENIEKALIIEEPVAGKEETCYNLILNDPTVSVVNDKLKKKFTIKYSKDTLPCFVEWKSMAAGDYALGLEPTTTHIYEGFKYNTIDAGESVNFFIEMTVENI
ncbi:MAG: DUF4432 family protein [Clostridia bacterium]|nr:DUF4432 family protein [Clostridia bacterium]